MSKINLNSDIELSKLLGKNVSFVNPFSYLIVRKDWSRDFIDNWYSDGIIFCILSFFMGRKIKRYSFDNTSLAPIVFEFCRRNNLKIAVVGSTDANNKNFCDLIRKKYSLDIVYEKSGFFADAEREISLKYLFEIQADIVVVGMGTPFQEQYLADLRKLGWSGTGFTCGGFIHQQSIERDYYPAWVNRLQLRFLYRFIYEKHTRYRYLFVYPVGCFAFIKDLIVRS